METEIINEFRTGLTEIKDGIGRTEKTLDEVKKEQGQAQKDRDELRADLNKMRRHALARSGLAGAPPARGQVSTECARWLASSLILHCARDGRLEILSQSASTRDALLHSAREFLGLEIKTALTTADIPLPAEYSGELRALIAQFGVVRKAMFPYPIGLGTAKPPRMGVRPQFASVAMSGAFPEGSPTITFASLESHKIGGLVRVPRELEEQSIVPLGQFLARYGAVEFARIEDTWGLLADGSNTYESVKGVCQIAKDNNKTVVLGATKTAPSDAVVRDFRNLRLAVATPVLNTGCYYMNATWEQQLRQFKTSADPLLYNQNGPNGVPTLDGYDVIWTEVLAPYSAVGSPGACVAVFGDLSFWWMGEHLHPRIDTSDQVFFVNDQLGVRFIEEIDFDYMDVAAASALVTAGA